MLLEKTMSNKVKYTLVDSGDISHEHWGIRIEDGQFSGLVFNFGVVKFVGEDDDGNAIIRFDYDIIEHSYGFIETDTPKLELAMSDILSTVLEDSLKEQLHGTNRDNSTEESNLL